MDTPIGGFQKESPQTKENVDLFFEDAERNDRQEMFPERYAHSVGGVRQEQAPPIRRALNRSAAYLGNEEYNAFAESASKDDRLNAYLPSLAISTMKLGHFLPPAERQRIDADGSGTISRDELKAAANDSNKFDPIYRKGLEFALKNFDKIRSMSPKDGKYFGDSSDITSSDLYKAGEELNRIAQLKRNALGYKQLVDNFENIDENKSGKITRSEVESWSRNSKMLPYPLPDSVLPALTGRLNQGSEELTRDQVQQRMLADEAELKRIKDSWGLK